MLFGATVLALVWAHSCDCGLQVATFYLTVLTTDSFRGVEITCSVGNHRQRLAHTQTDLDRDWNIRHT